MTTAGRLEQGYRRLLHCYPAPYRDLHEEEILGVLMAAARPGQRRPGARESLDLLWSALKIRIRMVLRGAGSEPWAGALALAGVLIPLLMLLMKLTLFLDRGAQYGFGTPADILVGAYGEPGSWTRSFQLNPYQVALSGNVTDALTAGPVPALILAALACLGLRRAAASFAVSVPAAFWGVALTNGYTMLEGWRTDVTLYAWGLEALILIAMPGGARGWRALRWRPCSLLAIATVAAGVGMNGGLGPLFYHPRALPFAIRARLHELGRLPHGFLAQRFGIGMGGWENWLLYQGTLIAVVVVALTVMLAGSPASRRTLALLALPFALGAVIYLCGLISPPPSAAAGNTFALAPLLLLLLAAMAVSLVRGRAGPDVPASPAGDGSRL